MKEPLVLNRRDFLIGAASAGLAGCQSPANGNSDSAAFPLGACCALEQVDAVKRAGFDFWETWTAVLGPDKDDAWWAKRKAEILAKPLPLRSCNGFIPGSFRLTGPKADHEPALVYAETAMRRAEEIGVKFLVFGSGGARNVPGNFAGPRSEWPDVQKGMEQYEGFCREICRRTADLTGVQVLIEPLAPNESNIVNYVWQGRQICERVDSLRLSLLADVYHMIEGGEAADSLAAASRWLRHCHVAEPVTRRPPGTDPMRSRQLVPYFNALKSIGYTGGVSCECRWGEAKDYERNLATAISTMKCLSGR